MKAVGLVVEYNPFHNGHRYHLAQAKRLTGADVVVATTSVKQHNRLSTRSIRRT